LGRSFPITKSPNHQIIDASPIYNSSLITYPWSGLMIGNWADHFLITRSTQPKVYRSSWLEHQSPDHQITDASPTYHSSFITHHFSVARGGVEPPSAAADMNPTFREGK
jgi:hypothetical protein